jgi:flagellar motor switch protein FliM
MFMGEKFGRDSIWETHLSGELWQTDVQISAVLDEFSTSLGTVLDWKPGTKLELECTPQSMVELRCGEVQLFRGHMGRRGGHIAVKIQDRLMK